MSATQSRADSIASTTPSPFYYGYVMIGVAAIAMTATTPGRTHGLGLITEPLLADLKISEVQFGWINFVTIVLGAAFCWPFGKLIDARGSRIAMTIVAAALGLSVIAMASVTTIALLVVTLTLIRGFGQGALSVVSTAMVGKWFPRRVDVAMGIFAVLLAIGFIGVIVAMKAYVESAGWRTAWAVQGWVILLGVAPIGWLFARSTPESMGYKVDASESSKNPFESATGRLRDLTFREAMQTPAFWVFSGASCLANAAWSAITLFNQGILESRGFDEHAFTLVMAILTGVGLIANLLGGWLASKQPLGRVLGLGMALFAVSLAVFPFVANRAQLIGYACAFGVGFGLITVVHFAFHPKAFGRSHLGQIQGFYQVLSVFMSALGPLIFAMAKEQIGKPEPIFFIMAGCSVLAALAVLVVPMPNRAIPHDAKLPPVRQEMRA